MITSPTAMRCPRAAVTARASASIVSSWMRRLSASHISVVSQTSSASLPHRDVGAVGGQGVGRHGDFIAGVQPSWSRYQCTARRTGAGGPPSRSPSKDRSTVRTGTAPQVMASIRKHRAQPAPPGRRRQHRRSLPSHRFQRRPRPQPPGEPPNHQVTSVLVNNAGTLGP